MHAAAATAARAPTAAANVSAAIRARPAALPGNGRATPLSASHPAAAPAATAIAITVRYFAGNRNEPSSGRGRCRNGNTGGSVPTAPTRPTAATATQNVAHRGTARATKPSPASAASGTPKYSEKKNGSRPPVP